MDIAEFHCSKQEKGGGRWQTAAVDIYRSYAKFGRNVDSCCQTVQTTATIAKHGSCPFLIGYERTTPNNNNKLCVLFNMVIQ